MNKNKISKKITRYSLGILLTLLALNAFAGGYYGMAGANNVPKEWLAGSPFSNYFIPGLILFTIVGSSALIAAIAVFQSHKIAIKASLISVIIVIVWLAAQIGIIGYVSWMQPTTLIATLIILYLTWKLSRYGD